MDIDKELSGAGRRLTASLADSPIPPSPRPPHRPWYATAIAAAVLTLGVVGVVYIATTNQPATQVAATTTTTETVPTTQGPGIRVYGVGDLAFEIDLPAGWRVAPTVLAPALAPGRQSLYEVLSIGTFEMRPGGDTCAYLPENAIRDMKPTDVLVSIRINGTSNSAPWPDLFSPDSWLQRGPESNIAPCTGRDDVDDRWATYGQGDHGIEVMAVFGDEVPDQTVLEAYGLINSFVVEDTDPPEPYVSGFAQSWSLQYGPDWHRADSELMPNLGGESTTLATFPLVPGGELCAHMPTNALSDLGPEDVMISIRLGGPLGSDRPAEGFSDDTFPTTPGTDVQECAEQPDLEAHWGSWTIDDNGAYLLVAFGENVSDQRRAEAWAILSSLRTEPIPAARDRGICIATRPPVPGLIPPDPWNPTPSDPETVWFGTADLWVPLHIDADYQERKSVWWSQNFTDAARESSPDIAVTYERIDRTAATIGVTGPGTNASTAQDGLFMIANIEYEPETPGCWTVTGEYKGATLSYVVNVP
jgi:hypothetical protein